MMILNLSESLAKPLVMAKLNMAYQSSLNKRAKLLSSYLPVSPSRVSVPPHFTVPFGARSTFGPRGPGLSNPTSFLRPALPMAPTRDDNARDKRSVLRPNPATFLKDFALYMTLKYAIIRKRCLNYTACLTVIRLLCAFAYHLIPKLKPSKTRGPRPEQSHLLPEACSPDGTENFRFY